MRTFATVLPWFLPGLALATVLALVFGRRIASRLGTSQAVAMLLVVAFGAVLAATIPPDRGGFGSGSRSGCDLGRLWLASAGEYLRINDTSLNVVLFVPLGLAVGLLPWRASSAAIWAVAIALPVLIEMSQLIVPALGRGCQTADIVDNLLGLAIGIAAAVMLRLVTGRAAR